MESTVSTFGSSMIYCHPCSVAGGAEMPVYHDSPACKVNDTDSKESPIEFVYVVGSCEKEKFIADRVYVNCGDAIDYCNKRNENDDIRWIVMKAPIGKEWFNWEVIHPS